jgi:two-component system, NarL family, sensor histidine kinase DesK
MSLAKAIHRRLLPPEAGWIPYLWLVYLSFFSIQYFFVQPTLIESAAIVLTLVAFLALYFGGYWKRGWALVPTIIGIGVIGTLWAPHNIGSGVFFIYAASFAGWLGPVRRAASAVIAVVAWAMAVAYLWQPHPSFWAPALVFGLIIGTISIYDATQRRRDAALRLSQEEVRQMARVAERERISRDMHDLLGHTLSVITLKAELAARILDRDPARAAAEIREVEQVSRAALADVREAISGIRTRGLVGELEHARVALKAAGVRLEVDGEIPTVTPAAEAVLAMVVREAVTNVVRHAQASYCRVVLRNEAGEAFVEVHDDGRGGKALAGGGIDGMRARLAAAGGRLEVGDEFGVRLRAWLPA